MPGQVNGQDFVSSCQNVSKDVCGVPRLGESVQPEDWFPGA